MYSQGGKKKKGDISLLFSGGRGEIEFLKGTRLGE